MKRFYSIAHKNEVGEYTVEGELTDFPRGVLLAYGNCCLTTGHKSKQEALDWMRKYPCTKGKAEGRHE